MEVVVLGSGTSHGVPMIGCQCAVCTSKNRKDKRTRSSILVRIDGLNLLFDTATDFRTQAIREGIQRVDAVFYTHTHADHLHGIDDLRQLSRHAPIPIYASRPSLQEIRSRFPYIFAESPYPNAKPQLDTIELDGVAVAIGSAHVRPIPVFHGSLPINGFRIGRFAYLTDCSQIPESSYELLEGVEIVMVDALRHKPHPTHFTVAEAIEAGKRIGARTTVLTHICHELDHAALERELPDGVIAAYDGLRFSIGD